MAVGIILGAAFGGIVQSLVKDIIMTPIGVLTGGIDFTNKFLVLKSGGDGAASYATLAEAAKAGAVTINWGTFLTLLINFIIVAFAVFMLVKSFNKLKREKPAEPAAPPAPSKEEILLAEIRDLLKARA